MIKYLTAGESHGPALTGILEGMPAGLEISEAEIALDLARRQLGHGRGDRMKIEQDRARILSGVRYGKTLGSPIALLIENRDWQNWTDKMSVADPGEAARAPRLTNPRPGHADLAGSIKYHQNDIRNIIERSSARETAMRVALGAISRKFLRAFGIEIHAHVVNIGGITAPSASKSADSSFWNRVEESPVRCADESRAKQMMSAIDHAIEDKDTVGGIFEVVVTGMPVGVGSFVHYDRRLDGILAQAMLSIHAIKAVEFGMGFDVANTPGSGVHDQIFASANQVVRQSNNAGGIEGGMSNSEAIVMRVAMKPLSSLMQPLASVNLETGESVEALRERSDVCAVPAAAVVGEAMTCLALMNPFFEKFGGDSMAEVRAHFESTPPLPWR